MWVARTKGLTLDPVETYGVTVQVQFGVPRAQKKRLQVILDTYACVYSIANAHLSPSDYDEADLFLSSASVKSPPHIVGTLKRVPTKALHERQNKYSAAVML